MRVLIQRVLRSSVTIDNATYSSIGNGLLVFVGVEEADTEEDVEWLVGKIARLRIFDDVDDVMNLDVMQVNGEIMVVSQFTLHASTKKGNRPSYLKAAPESIAKPLYEMLAHRLTQTIGKNVQTGLFGADMKIELLNNGPVTIAIDSKNRE